MWTFRQTSLLLLLASIALTGCRFGGDQSVEVAVENAPCECSLSDEEFDVRVAEISDLLENHRRAQKKLANGYAIHFDGGETVHAQVVALSKKEMECCPFLEWKIDSPKNDRFWVEVSGPPEAQELLSSLVSQ